MLNNDDARIQLSKYGLGDVDCISDRDRNLYKAFGLRRGRLYQIFGLECGGKGLLKVSLREEVLEQKLETFCKCLVFLFLKTLRL